MTNNMTVQQQQQRVSPLGQIDRRVKNEDLETGLAFLLSHFIDYNEEEESSSFLFPRKISTYKSNNKQFLVRSNQEIIDSFIDSDSIDSKINAYAYLTEYKGIQRYKPNFIFIDIDKNNFKTDRSFKLALYNTLKNIKNKLNGYPTVLFTGGGYHIYQPVYIPTALEYITEFSKFERPSEQFLRFAKDYLSKGKADKQNNPSFRSCLLRIPGSINSKHNMGVKIVQKWNGYRPPITRKFIEEFRTCLIQKKIDQQIQRQKMMTILLKSKRQNNITTSTNYYGWIDKVLQTSFPDCRKIIVDLVLAPYLINIKKLSYEHSYQIIREWLDKCNNLKKLDNYQNFVNYRVHSALKTATQKGIGPMSIYKIKTDDRYRNSNLYHLILQNK